MKRQKNHENGITIISLVVTIMLIFILAFVTIGFLTGEKAYCYKC